MRREKETANANIRNQDVDKVFQQGFPQQSAISVIIGHHRLSAAPAAARSAAQRSVLVLGERRTNGQKNNKEISPHSIFCCVSNLALHSPGSARLFLCMAHKNTPSCTELSKPGKCNPSHKEIVIPIGRERGGSPAERL
jgi:hypothetical protein